MPGTPDLRAQAKWQQKCAKKDSTQVDAEQTLRNVRTTTRDLKLKEARTLFEKTFSENVLKYLHEYRKDHWTKWRGVGGHFIHLPHTFMRVPMQRILISQLGRGKNSMFDLMMEKYVPYYEKGVKLSDREFREALDKEIKRTLDDMCDERLRSAHGPFNRTLDRTNILKDELLLTVNKFNCIRACRTIKEELVAVAWHPDRVWKWIKAGRYLGLVNGEPEHAYNVLNMMAGYESD
jgi:hypothetical protein